MGQLMTQVKVVSDTTSAADLQTAINTAIQTLATTAQTSGGAMQTNGLSPSIVVFPFTTYEVGSTLTYGCLITYQTYYPTNS